MDIIRHSCLIINYLFISSEVYAIIMDREDDKQEASTVIHTIDISTQLTSFTYEELKRELGAPPDRTLWRTNAYAASGLTKATLYRISSQRFTGHFLRLSMNPHHVMRQAADPMALFDPQDFAELIPAFDDLLRSIINVSLPSLPDWLACRIDYAADAEVNNSSTRPSAGRYIDLARRGFLPVGANNQTGAGWISFRAGNKSGSVQLYHRGPALRSRFTGLAEDVYLRADRLLRLEVQSKKGRLASLARKHRFPDRTLQRFMMSPNIGHDELTRQCRRIFGSFGFVSYRKAAAQINRNAALQRRTKADILNLLKAVEVAGGIVAAQEKWRQGTPISLHFAKQRLNVQFSNAQVFRLLRRLVQVGQHLVVGSAAWRMGVIEHPFPAFADQCSDTP